MPDEIKQFPAVFSQFDDKIDARYAGDPKGDYIMAEHVNSLQRAILAIEKYLGLSPDLDTPLAERLTNLESLASPSLTQYHWYQSLPSDPTVLMERLSRWDTVIVNSVPTGLANRQANFSFRLVLALNGQLSLNLFQTYVGAAKEQGVTGILIRDFHLIETRTRQQSLLNSVAEAGLTSLIQTQNPTQLFSNDMVSGYNPNQLTLTFPEQTALLLENFAYNTQYVSPEQLYLTTYPLVRSAKARGVKLVGMGRPTSQVAFNYFQTAALLFSLDGILNSQLDGLAHEAEPPVFHAHIPYFDWQTDSLTVSFEQNKLSRQIKNATLSLEHEGIATIKGPILDSAMVGWTNSTVPGSVIKPGSLPPNRLSGYEIDKIIELINNSSSDLMIDVTKIRMGEGGGLPASIPAANMRLNVIEAINTKVDPLSTEKNQITSAAILSLDAGKLTGNIRRELFEEYAIPAINARDSQTNYIDVSRIDAINLNSTGTISGNVFQGDTFSGRVMQATEAISTTDLATSGYHYGWHGEYERLFVEWLTVEKLDGLKWLHVENLTADNMGALFLTAIQAYIKEGHFETIITDSLEAETVKVGLITALNSITDNSITNSALIGEGMILDGHILNLDAGKLNAGVINTSTVNLSSEDGRLSIQDNNLRIYDEEDTDGNRRLRVALGNVSDITSGLDIRLVSYDDRLSDLDDLINSTTDEETLLDLNRQHAQLMSERAALLVEIELSESPEALYGLVVMGKDGTSRLFDNTGIYNAGLHDNVISEAKLQENSVGGRVIQANSIFTDHLQSDTILARHISAEQINAFHITSNAIVARHITSDEIETRHLKAGLIDATKLQAGIITSEHIAAESIHSSRIKIGQFSNLVADGYDSFEQEPTGIFPGIVLKGTSSGEIVKITADSVQSEAWAYDGVKSLKLGGNSTSNRVALMKSEIDYSIMLTPGVTYFVSAHVKTYNQNPVPVSIGMTFNKDVPDIQSDSFSVPRGIGTTRVFLKFTVPETVLRGAVVLGVETTNASVFFDCIQVEQQEEPFMDLEQTTPSQWRSVSTTTIDGASITTGYISAQHIRIGSGTVFGQSDGSSLIDITDEGIKAISGDRKNQLIKYAMLNSSGLEVVGGAFNLKGGIGDNEISITGESGIEITNPHTYLTLNGEDGIQIVNKNRNEIILDISPDGNLRFAGSARFYSSDSPDMTWSLEGVGQQLDTLESNISGPGGLLENLDGVEQIVNEKSKVFSSQPTPPYRINDLWVQGDTGDLLRSTENRVSGAPFILSDWVSATKYTDDTLSKELRDDVNVLIESTDERQSIRLGMKVNYKNFTTPGVNYLYFSKRETAEDTFGDRLTDENGSLYDFTTNTLLPVPKQVLNLNGLEEAMTSRNVSDEATCYIIFDASTALIWLIFYCREYTEQLNPETNQLERWASDDYWVRWNTGLAGSNQKVTLDTNLYIIGEVNFS